MNRKMSEKRIFLLLVPSRKI